MSVSFLFPGRRKAVVAKDKFGRQMAIPFRACLDRFALSTRAAIES